MALPTLYDLTDPSSNLADVLSFDLTPLDKYRFTFGEGLVPGGIGAVFGYENYGWKGAILGAIVGYMAPLPAVSFILLKAGSDALQVPTALQGYSSRRRYRRRR